MYTFSFLYLILAGALLLRSRSSKTSISITAVSNKSCFVEFFRVCRNVPPPIMDSLRARNCFISLAILKMKKIMKEFDIFVQMLISEICLVIKNGIIYAYLKFKTSRVIKGMMYIIARYVQQASLMYKGSSRRGVYSNLIFHSDFGVDSSIFSSSFILSISRES